VVSIGKVASIRSAVTERLPSDTSEPSTSGASIDTWSSPSPPSIASDARKSAATEWTVTVSFPAPVSSVSETAGLPPVAGPVSTKVTWSAPPPVSTDRWSRFACAIVIQPATSTVPEPIVTTSPEAVAPAVPCRAPT
jgi:hypothetical protein